MLTYNICTSRKVANIPVPKIMKIHYLKSLLISLIVIKHGTILIANTKQGWNQILSYTVHLIFTHYSQSHLRYSYNPTLRCHPTFQCQNVRKSDHDVGCRVFTLSPRREISLFVTCLVYSVLIVACIV